MTQPARQLSESNPYRVLLVDDESGQRFLQREILSSPDFEVREATDGRSALKAIREHPFDVVLLDKRMPGMTGDEVCRRIREEMDDRLLPVIMVTGMGSSDELARSLNIGATDFIRKPYTPTELIARVEAAASHKRLLDQLEHVESIYFVVARMVEARDWHTGRHCVRLAHNGALFGRYLGLDDRSIELLEHLGTLHDIGKLAIPDHILLKQEQLNAQEERVMRLHPVVGARLCSGIKALEPLVPLIRHHHEHWDGSGYPDGLRGEEVPYLARVFQLLDIYDALAAERPYKGVLPHGEIIRYLERERDLGRLDPELAGRFLDFLQESLGQMQLPAGGENAPDDFSIVESLMDLEPEAKERASIPPLAKAELSSAGRRWRKEDAAEFAGQPRQDASRLAVVDYSQLSQRFAAILDATTVGLFGLDRDGRVTFVNGAACRLLGHSEEGLLGGTHHDRVHYAKSDGSTYPLSECPIHQSLQTGKIVHGEELFFHRDGRGIAVEFTCSPLVDGGEVEGVVVTFQDISERKAVKRRLRLATTVFDNTHDGILVTDEKGTILTVNPAFSEITGYSEAEVRGQNPRLLRSGKQRADFYEAMWSTIRQRGRWQGEIRNRNRDGDIFPAWLTISSVKDDQGEVTNYVGIFSDISPLKHSLEQIEHLANHDPLTGLPNRLLFLDRLKVAVRQARRGGHALAVLFLDIDRFKDINDSLGHAMGDQLLLEMAARVRGQVREEDTVARLGGDEFVILIGDVESASEAELVARKVMQGLEVPIRLETSEIILRVSMGISLYPNDGESADELIRHADIAMYHAKERGLSEYHFYNDEMSAGTRARLAMESALRRAIEGQEFELHYQPQVNLADGGLCGAEALLRWHHPQEGLVTPDRFIPLAEETGLIEPIGAWVLESACRQAVEWQVQGISFGRIAINVSGVQIRRGTLVERVTTALELSGLDPTRLELEITESVIMEQTGQTLTMLQELKSLGVQLSVDDFGTGYSSLSYLQHLPVDKLKIDRAFVCNLPNAGKDKAIARAVIALGQGLGLQTIAEGVETEAQRDFLRQHGCQEGQGWLFGRPMTSKLFTQRYVGH
ncbi:EAL domain-containing protein [Candidatus Endoriftia persephone]|jgi:diguanylate cyclase (GGDEF)-like protein/PAS domain S-box-containing protein|uniref:cyclic-guanylate-specific phosphodiesterase n=3 Tax=Gammaproteobacteria TaxID=1236 RepID=G2FF90_9GAMM|nr:EAL domain-containing protein [Candidatus Endoriftia persephone]EGV52297.1 putative signaling protein [endosymbiont of Riftia pachyptila (vent Ph05)]EGW54468.1 putative signaling protein [endosymbiont of Tevnia jerichonana (vent Tica)]USF89012.1 EAL domain-containing protein [Candidatus Endoriftia persephone]